MKRIILTLGALFSIYSGIAFGQAFTVGNPTPCSGHPMQITNIAYYSSGTTYNWYFGDGSNFQTSSDADFSYTYQTPGMYTIYLEVRDIFGLLIDSYSTSVQVIGLQPYSGFTASKSELCPGESISFSAPWGYSAYTWDMGDGSASVTNQNSWTQYSFATPGSYSTQVMIHDVCPGVDTTFSVSLDVVSSMYFANSNGGGPGGTGSGALLSSWPPAPCPVEYVNLNAQYGLLGYVWNYGDGSPIDSSNYEYRSHLYSNAGNYTASVKLYNFCGQDTTVNAQVVVAYPPFPSGMQLMASASPVCPGEPVQMNVPQGYVAYVWDYGDGSPVDSGMAAQRTHAFASVGSYTVAVRIHQLCGNDTTLYQVIDVNSYVPFSGQLAMNCNPSPACPFSPISHTTLNTFLNYEWNFNDGTPIITGNSGQKNHQYTAGGTYYPEVAVTNFCGNDTTLIGTVVINENLPFPPNIGIQFSGNPTCPGAVTLGAPNGFKNYTWNFGDGTVSSALTANQTTHNYPDTGSYVVSLKIRDYCGKDTNITGMLNVRYTPFQSGLALSSTQQTVCPGEVVDLYAPWGYTSYIWDYGDGDVVTGSNYNNHKFAEVGIYQVQCTLAQLCGNDTTISLIVKVINNKPFPQLLNLNYYPSAEICQGAPIDFNAPYGYRNYTWDFGDGNTANNSVQYIRHQFADPGVYDVQVNFENMCGLDTTMSTMVVIENQVGFNSGLALNSSLMSGASACPGQPININAPWGYPTYVWNFGDGSGADSLNSAYTTHSFPGIGVYTVSVKLYNYCGEDTTLTLAVRVEDNSPLPGTLSWNAPSGNYCPGAKIDLYGPYNYASYIWDFGDGTPADTNSVSNIRKAYAAPGDYTISLTVANYCGVDTTFTGVIHIDSDVPISNTYMNVYPNPICPGQEAQIYTTYNMESYYWNFDDGFTSYGPNSTNHSFASEGTYNISVTLTNYCGVDTTLETEVVVNTTTSFPSWMSMYANPNQICPGEATTLQTQGGFGYYHWNFGDGDTMTTVGNTIQHQYDAEGSYDVAVTIINGCGNSTTLFSTVTVGTSVNAYSPGVSTQFQNYCPGDEVVFMTGTASGTGGGNGNPGGGGGGANSNIYTWNYGDGVRDTTVGIGTTHIYDSTGVYTVTMKTTNLCGNSATVSIPVKITGNAKPDIKQGSFGTFSKTNIVGCPGDAVVFFFEGSGQNLWDFGDGYTGVATEEFINSSGQMTTVIKHAFTSAGTYSVKLTLTNECGNTNTDSITVKVLSNLLVDGGLIKEAPLNGGSYSTCNDIHFIAFGGSTYEWIFGDGTTETTISPTVSHNYSEEGNYAMSVIISNGCGNSATYSTALSVTNSSNITLAQVTAMNVTCPGGADGHVDLVVNGGNGEYSYAWSDNNSSTSSSVSGLSAGQYSVTVADEVGCWIDTAFTIADGPVLELDATPYASSCGTADGALLADVVSGGTAPFDYLWSDGTTGQYVANLSAGAYSVTVTDANSCTNIATFAVSDADAPGISISGIDMPSCSGDADAAIYLTTTGNQLTYLWSNGATTEDLTGISAGTYALTVTDASGCKTTIISTVAQPEELSVSFATNSANCGDNNGSATAYGVGGTAPYTYHWSSSAGGSYAQTAINLSANAYEITVTDANGCAGTDVATVSNSNSPELVVKKENVTCPGLSDGYIDLTVTKGTTPYSFIWTWSGGGSFTEDQNNLPAGNYTVMVQDASNCWIGTSVTISEPVISLNTSVLSVTCHGASTGSASVIVSGGSSPYVYSWNSGSTDASITGLAAGTYTVTMTDYNNCALESEAIVTEPAAMVSGGTVTDVTCFGGSNGAISAVPVGGASPYDYQWNQGTIVSEAEALSAGNYTVTITDACGNSDAHTFSVQQPALLTTNMSATAVSCYNGGDGTASVAASGGTPPYNYSWNNGQVTSTASGLFAGTHAVNVFDLNGCLASNFIIVSQPGMLTASLSAGAVNCNGGSDGSVDITLSGGTAPYSYLWSNANTTEDLASVSAGNYTITITDACSASITKTGQVSEPGILVLLTDGSDVSCNAGADGSVSVSVNGGVSPYTYLWNSGMTTTNLSGLIAGTYSVTVTDNCGLEDSLSFVVNEPAPMNSTIAGQNVTCHGDADGSSTVIATGGTTPYSYMWSNNQTTATAVGLFPGNYTVNVFDKNGCFVSNFISVSQPQTLATSIVSTAASCNGQANGKIESTVTGGTLPYSYSWSDGSTTQNINNIPTGTYSLTVSDGCADEVSMTAVVSEPQALSVTSQAVGATCNGSGNGSAVANPSGGTSPYYYQWSTGSTEAGIQSLSAGNYNVTITDNCGATVVDTIEIMEPLAFTAQVSGTDVTCYGQGDGTATVGVLGGTSPYTYYWSNTQTGSTAVGLFPGTYTVNVVDNKGCLASAITTINQPQALQTSIQKLDVTCHAGQDGEAVVQLSGGTMPYGFLWSDGSTEMSRDSLFAGSYQVTVTDQCGASAVQIAIIGQPSLLQVAEQVTAISCLNGNDGQIILNYSGGTSPYSFNWNNGGQSGMIAGLTSGDYIYTVTDLCGAEVIDTVTLIEPSALTIAITGTNITCNGQGDGTAAVTPAGGTAPYTYNWNNGQTSAMAVGLFPGLYSVNVLDSKGCLASNNIHITQPAALSASTAMTGSTCGETDGVGVISASGGVAPYSYLWSNTDTTSVADTLGVGTATVTVSDANGCSSVFTGEVDALTNPVEICMITVDSTSTKNVIVWEKPVAGNISGFNVYREIAGVYTLIGFTPYSALSEFTDDTQGVNPKITSYRYKISVIDTCGEESTQSASHKTMHLTINNGSGGSVNLIWDGYEGLSYSYFRIYRDDNGTGNFAVLDSVSANNFTYTDQAPPTGNTQYLIEIGEGLLCTSTIKSKNYNSSRSNVSQKMSAAGQLLATTVSADASFGTCDGEATVTASGGTPPYTYQWDGNAAAQTAATATGLCEGTYSVVVTDSLGQQTTVFATIGEMVGLQNHSGVNELKIYPNPGDGNFMIQTDDIKGLKIVVTDMLGATVGYRMNHLSNSVLAISLASNNTGVYLVQVIGDNWIVKERLVVR